MIMEKHMTTSEPFIQLRKIVVALWVFVPSLMVAQTNTFPSSGAVGVGTTSPENSEGWQSVFQVYGEYHAKALVSSSVITSGLWSHGGGIYGSVPGGIVGTWTNHPFTVMTNQLSRMTVLTNGNLGIGTTSPDQKLTVAGNITIDSGTDPVIYTSTGGADNNRFLQLVNSTANGTAARLKTGGLLVSDTYNYANPARNDAVVKGFIGIGTPTPVARLHSKITGSTNTTYTSYTNADVALVLQNGNATNNNFNILTYSDASGYGVADVGTITNHTNHTAKLFFSTRPASSVPLQRMLIDENGNVGIGTPAPGFKLSVATGSTNTNRNALTDPDVGIAIQNSSATNNNFSSLLFFDANGYISSGVLSQTKSHSSHTGTISLATRNNGGALTTQLYVDETGKVGIGSLNPSELLTVNGKIYGKQVKVDLSVPGPDYVFAESYALPTLDEVKSYIDENKHLPEVPSAKEMEAKGIDVGEMNMLLLKKVEELTLYLIQQQKQIDELKKNQK
jgi:hypothetical protein